MGNVVSMAPVCVTSGIKQERVRWDVGKRVGARAGYWILRVFNFEANFCGLTNKLINVFIFKED